MAYTATTPAYPRLLTKLDALRATFARAFDALIEARSRRNEIERLQKMSDTQLARLGLTRDGIVQHVFRDHLGL
ncbi:hypothetical protein C4N9_04650 [Pararhodobacter marinus]|uniref:DUF1127 domain-containing protein n=1 Tax=Pararhodobacter marinus TaxID=2184063 RepID=A0A2U2CGZ3_9RHOB|nr:hypothetical protein [Pararhodobacter marinus]PWE31044.1 hypothetical protein C4N9_04650 [Pararhodobacter marinus]